MQQLLLDQWVGDRSDLCVVGDPRQTIYSFAGASATYLTRFPLRHPDATVVKLVRNYRSSPQVVALANRVFAAGGPGRAPLAAQRPAGPVPRFIEYDDERVEAQDVARQAAALVADGVPASQIAILVRTNSMTIGFEDALADAGLAYQLRGAERFYERAEVRQAIGLLRVAARSAADDEEPLSPDPPGAQRPGPDGGAAGRARQGGRALAVAGLARPASPRSSLPPSPGATLADLAAELVLRSALGHAPDPGRGHAGLAARGQGPGVGRCLHAPACPTARCRSATRRRPRRSRKSAACCTWGSPERSGYWCCPGRSPGSQAAGSRRSGRGSWTICAFRFPRPAVPVMRGARYGAQGTTASGLARRPEGCGVRRECGGDQSAGCRGGVAGSRADRAEYLPGPEP